MRVSPDWETSRYCSACLRDNRRITLSRTERLRSQVAARTACTATTRHVGYTECVLHEGHRGDHEDEEGVRWPDDEEEEEEEEEEAIY